MPDSATLAVLRDLASLTVISLFLGILFYSGLRGLRPTSGWLHSGKVICDVYSTPDLYLSVVLGSIMLVGLIEGGTPPEQSPTVSFPELLFNVVFMLLMCAGLLTYLVLAKKRSPTELFGLQTLSFFSVIGRALAYIVPLYIFVSVLAALVSQWALNDIWPANGPQESVRAFQEASGLGVKVLMIIAAVIVAPIVEETVFRGFIYAVIKRYTDGYFAAITSSLIFAIVHLHVGSVVPLFCLALGLCLAYERTGSLLVPMWMHAFFNGTSMTLLVFGADLPD
jgi:uncharacterized protein